jgi:hypothetical protein
MPHRNAVREVATGWILPIAAVVVSLACTLALVMTWVSRGDHTGLFWWLAGVMFGLAVITIALVWYRRSLGQQLARIDTPIGTVVVQAKGMDSLRTALDRAKILPTWTPRNIAVTFSRQGVSFLADVRRPFVFGKLAAADVQGVQTEVSYGRPRALAEIVVQVQVGSEIVDIPIAPLKLTHEFVVQATTAEATQLARDALHALGLPAHAE